MTDATELENGRAAPLSLPSQNTSLADNMDTERNNSTSLRARRESRHASRQEVVAADANELAALVGHEQELVRQFGPWTMFALAFSVLGTWSTLAQNLATGLSNGGSVCILWGLVLVTICNLCVAVSLGELLSYMPSVSETWSVKIYRILTLYRHWDKPTGFIGFGQRRQADS